MGIICLAFLLMALWSVYLITIRTSRDLNRNNENTKEWEFFSFEDYFERTKTPMVIVHLYGKKCRFLLDSRP
jgi:competence protein ComGF